MIRVRLAFYVLYIALGVVILARILSLGFRAESLIGIVFALALVGLGVYRICLFTRSRPSSRHS